MAPAAVGIEDARRLEECVAAGGVAVFPADTVYGLCCDPLNESAVRRLYELKGRPAERPAAVMFFSPSPLFAALADLGDRERSALRALLPGPVTLLLAKPGPTVFPSRAVREWVAGTRSGCAFPRGAPRWPPSAR